MSCCSNPLARPAKEYLLPTDGGYKPAPTPWLWACIP